MKNYRKARKWGDITCANCCHHQEPRCMGGRIRCRIGMGPSYAVGKKNTCDDAYVEKKEVPFEGHIIKTQGFYRNKKRDES